MGEVSNTVVNHTPYQGAVAAAPHQNNNHRKKIFKQTLIVTQNTEGKMVKTGWNKKNISTKEAIRIRIRSSFGKKESLCNNIFDIY